MKTEDRDYQDIIALPHYVSKDRPHMSNHDRAAQFLPFSALTGYEETISEAARLTEDYVEPGEMEKVQLDRKCRILLDHLKEIPEVHIRYFQPDPTKKGGSFREEDIRVKKIDAYQRKIITDDRRVFDLDLILDLEGELFDACLDEQDL